jgi:hypothetical protein
VLRLPTFCNIELGSAGAQLRIQNGASSLDRALQGIALAFRSRAVSKRILGASHCAHTGAQAGISPNTITLITYELDLQKLRDTLFYNPPAVRYIAGGRPARVAGAVFRDSLSRMFYSSR